MNMKVRDAYALLLGVDDKPVSGDHCARKSILSCEVVNVGVYNTVYNTVYRNSVKPRPHTKQLPRNRVAVDTERASNAPHFRLVG